MSCGAATRAEPVQEACAKALDRILAGMKTRVTEQLEPDAENVKGLSEKDPFGRDRASKQCVGVKSRFDLKRFWSKWLHPGRMRIPPTSSRSRPCRQKTPSRSAGKQKSQAVARKPTRRVEYILFDVTYEDDSRRSNRKVPALLLSGLEKDEPAKAEIERQDREIAERSGLSPLVIKNLQRSEAK